MKNIRYSLSVGLVLMLLLAGAYFEGQRSQPEKVEASIMSGQGYQGTTTTPGFKNNSRLLGNDTTGVSGILGSVIITGLGTSSGNIELYDATTTCATCRAASMSTSTIIVASFPNTATAGTYTFDRELKYGLIISVNPTGAVNTWTNGFATTSVTWKQ